jgi:hypothetical protein
MKRFSITFLLVATSAVAGAEPAGEWTYPVTYRDKPVAGAKVGLVVVTYATPAEPKAGEPIFATTDDKGSNTDRWRRGRVFRWDGS